MCPEGAPAEAHSPVAENNRYEKMSRWFLGKRTWVLAIQIAITVACIVASVYKLRIVTELEYFFLQSDPDLVAYETLQKQFGADEFIIFSHTDDDALGQKSLEYIQKLVNHVRATPGVIAALSAATATDLDSIDLSGTMPKMGEPIIKSTTLSDADKRYAMAKLASTNIYRNLLISPDMKTAFVYVVIEGKPSDPSYRMELTKQMEKARDEAGTPPGVVRMAGTPVYATELYRAIVKDLTILTPIVLLFSVIVLILTFRNLLGVLIPALSMIVSTIWLLGMFAFTNIPIWASLVDKLGSAVGLPIAGQVLGNVPLTIANSVVIPVILVIGVNFSVHIITHYYHTLEEFPDKQEAVVVTMGRMIRPCFYSSLTTAVGFLSLATANVLPVIQTGLITAASIMASFVASITLTPILLYLTTPPKAEVRESVESGLMDKVLKAISKMNRDQSMAVVIASFAFLGLSVWGAAYITVETNPIKFFSSRTEFTKNYYFFEQNLGGTIPFEVFIEPSDKGAKLNHVRDYWDMDKIANFLDRQDEITGVLGPSDVMAEGKRALFGGPRMLPTREEEVDGVLRLLPLAKRREPLLSRFITPDGSAARITSRVKAISSTQLTELISRTELYINEQLKPHFTGRVSGVVRLMSNMIDKVTTSQINSLSVSALVMFIQFWIVLKSFSRAFIAFIPNILPVMFTLGVMGALGIPLDLATCMSPSIAIGLVDNTIHFLIGFNQSMEDGMSYEEAIDYTTNTRGKAFMFSSAILIGGFAILCISDLIPVVHFGILTVTTIIGSLIGDIIMHQALIWIFKPGKADLEKKFAVAIAKRAKANA